MTSHYIPKAALRNVRRETRTYPASRYAEAGSYEVDMAEVDVQINDVTREVTVDRVVVPDADPLRMPSWHTNGRPATVRVGGGMKTYAVDLLLLDVEYKVPGMLALASPTALNRQASWVGWVDQRDETNVRSGYGMAR